MQKTLFTRIRTESYVFALALIATTVLFAQTAFAQSSKATAAINTAVGCTYSSAANPGDPNPQNCHNIFTGDPVPVDPVNFFATVMTSTIKVSNSQSLFVSPSLVTGLYTQTQTKTRPSQDGSTSTSTATASGGVYLRAIITNLATSEVQVGEPVNSCVATLLGCGTFDGSTYGVTLNTRVQTLTQEISACVVMVGTSTGTCDFTSTIDLILKTTSAHTFNFIFPNVGVGTYKVEIQAAVNSGAFINAGSGTASGAAAYGLGSLTVESVRLVHDFQF